MKCNHESLRSVGQYALASDRCKECGRTREEIRKEIQLAVAKSNPTLGAMLYE